MHTKNPKKFIYYPFIHKTLFQLNPKHTHKFTFQQLHHITKTPFKTLIQQKIPTKPINYINLTFKNPLNLTTNLNKNKKYINTLNTIKFKSIKINTITPHPQPNNNKPHLFHLINTKNLINHINFNNLNINNLIKNIKKTHYNNILNININKNKNTPIKQNKNNYLIYIKKIYTYTKYITINISSPNTPKLHTLQYNKTLNNLLTTIKNKQNNLQTIHHKYIPITIKITPNLSKKKLIQITNNLIHHNINNIITTNTTLNHSLIQKIKNYNQTNNLNNHPLQLKNTKIIHHLSLKLNNHLPIININNINSIITTHKKITTNTSLIQIYSNFIFKNPPLIKKIITHI